MENLLIVDGTEENSYIELGEELFHHIKTPYEENKQLIILCIGTDRCTGDSLGPISGDKLKNHNLNNFFVYGTLENPIHAKNISEYIYKIKSMFKNPFIIAIDASLGKISNIGNITLKNTPLSPGLALNKTLPKIGDLSLTGIVNIAGNFEFLVLQNTRLYTVMLLSNTIFKSFAYADKLLSKTSKKIINVSPQTFKRS